MNKASPLRNMLIAVPSEDSALLCEAFISEFSIYNADSSDEVLAMLRSIPAIDIIILGMGFSSDDFDLLQTISSDPALRNIPVLLTMEDHDEARLVRAFDLGVADIFVRPYNARVLRSRVQNIMNGVERAVFATEKAALNARLQHQSEELRLSQYDLLTGLFTRDAFYKKVIEMVSERDPGYYAIASFDIYRFKVINDQYGIDAGDRTLVYIANLTRNRVEPLGGICCRVMADNFAAIYPAASVTHSDITNLLNVASHGPDGRLNTVRISVGLYTISDVNMLPSAMYDRAVMAKNSIKGRYDTSIAEYNESMRENLLREQDIISRAPGALADGQFEMWLQPQYDHAQGTIIGAEALARWRRPGGILLSPAFFVPLFERNGFIYELDKYIWEQACWLLRKWRDSGSTDLPISVNISRYDIFQLDFFSKLTGLVRKYNLPPELLHLEITESAFVNNTQRMVAMVEKLSDFGFCIEIDDFGSGYSSLNILKDVPADTLKLDMRFLKGTNNSQRGGNILESIVRMSMWLGMSVIAEGVETLSQADFLKSIGCCQIQGYLYARPMELDHFDMLLSESRVSGRPAPIKTISNMNTASFWDPDSIDTLIFSSYVGGACVLSISDETCAIVRINDKCLAALNTTASLHEIVACDPVSMLSADEVDGIYRQLIHSAETGDEVRGEFQFNVTLDDPAHIEYLRYNARVIAQSSSHKIVYFLLENITEQRNARQAIADHNEQLTFLNEISQILLSGGNADANMNAALDKVLAHFDGDRAYVVEFDKMRCRNVTSYEVTADGIPTGAGMLNRLPFDLCSVWPSFFQKHSYLIYPDVEALDDSQVMQRETLKRSGIRSLIAVPLRREGQVIGFMGVDAPRRRLSQMARLKALGDYIAVMLTSRDLNARLLFENEKLNSVMASVPGGLIIFEMDGDRITTPYFNDPACTIFGYTREEHHASFGKDVFSVVHPDDRSTVESMVRQSFAKSGKRSALKYRHITKDGSWRWVQLTGGAPYRHNGLLRVAAMQLDIDARERAEAELGHVSLELQKRLYYGDLINAVAPGLVMLFDFTTYQIRFMIGALMEGYGYTSDEFVAFQNDGLRGFVHPDDFDSLRYEVDSHVAEGADYEIEYRIIKKDGGIAWITERAIRVDVENQQGLYVVIELDRTSSHEIAERLRIDEEEARITMVEAGKTICRYNVATGTLSMPRKYARHHHLPETLEGVPYCEAYTASFQSSEELEPYLAFYERIINGESFGGQEFRLVRSDGSVTYERMDFVNIFDNNANPVRAVIAIEDVTEIHRAAEESERLRRRENEIESMMAEMGRMILHYDVPTRTLTVPARYAQKHNISEVTSNVPASIINSGGHVSSGDDEDDFTEFYRAIIRGDRTGKRDVRFILPDGSAAWERAEFINIFGNDDKPVRAVISLEDVTEEHSDAEKSARLKKSTMILSMVAEHSERSVCYYDLQSGDARIWGSKPCELCGNVPICKQPPESLISGGVILHDSVETMRGIFRDIHAGVKNGEAKLHIKNTKGERRWYSYKFTTAFSDDGQPSFAVISNMDVTDEYERELAYARYVQAMEDNTRQSMALFEIDLTADSIEKQNGRMRAPDVAFTGAAYSAAVESMLARFFSEPDRSRAINYFSRDTLLSSFAAGERELSDDWQLHYNDGSMHWLHIALTLVSDPYTAHIRSFVRVSDVTDAKEQQMDVERRAMRDSMTGLYNHGTIERMISNWLANTAGQNCMLIIIDLDDLKMINDTLGHTQGDRALLSIAETLKTHFRRDDFVGRLGGDEFIAFLPNITNEAAVRNTVRAFVRKISGNRIGENNAVRIHCSAGCASGRSGDSFETLYKHADLALYNVKRHGKNGFAFYTPQMQMPATKQEK